MVKTEREEKQTIEQSKLSHRHSYNANSGVNVIFAAATKTLLYIDVRNKYCAIRSIAQKRSSLPPPQHMCLKIGAAPPMQYKLILL